jgi:hypothetical protein
LQKSGKKAIKATEVTFGYQGHPVADLVIALILETKLGPARQNKPKTRIKFP